MPIYQSSGTSLEGHLQFLLPTECNDRSNINSGEIVQIPSSCIPNSKNTQMYSTVRIQRKGGISLDMCNFQFIGEVGDDCFVKVGAGVTRNTLNEALRCVIEKNDVSIACVLHCNLPSNDLTHFIFAYFCSHSILFPDTLGTCTIYQPHCRLRFSFTY